MAEARSPLPFALPESFAIAFNPVTSSNTSSRPLVQLPLVFGHFLLKGSVNLTLLTAFTSAAHHEDGAMSSQRSPESSKASQYTSRLGIQ